MRNKNVWIAGAAAVLMGAASVALLSSSSASDQTERKHARPPAKLAGPTTEARKASTDSRRQPAKGKEATSAARASSPARSPSPLLAREPAPAPAPAFASTPTPAREAFAGEGALELVQLDRAELRRLIPTLSDPAALQAAVYALCLSLAPTDEDVALFERLLRTATDEKLVSTLLMGLSMRPDVLPLATIDYCLGDPRPGVRSAALRAIGTHPADEAAALVARTATGDPDPAVRGDAVFYLGLRPPAAEEGDAAAASARLATCLARETDPEVRSRWVNVLGTLGTPESQQAIVQVLYSSEESDLVRREALESLALLDDPAVLAPLAEDARLPEPLRARAAELAMGSGEASTSTSTSTATCTGTHGLPPQ